MGNYAKYMVGSFSFHQVKVEEIENGLKITETFDTDIVERVISMNSFPFIRTTNEDGFDTYQILDNVGEIYNLPAKADEFILTDINGSTFLPSDGVELIEDSLQLAPFRKAGAVNEVVALGEITATTTSINLAVHSSGSNKVRLNGSLYIKSTENNWTFPEITEDSTFLIYALPDSEIFHLTDTEVPNGGYLVRTVNISDTGGIIVEEEEDIPTASDAWRTISLTTNPQWVQITAPFASTLNLIPNAAGREFAGVNTKFRKNGWDGKNIFLRNDSEFDLVLKPTTTTAANTTFYTFEEEQVLKAHAWKLFKIREVGGDFFLVEVVLGGGAEFPEGGVAGNVLEYDAVDGAKWSNRLTTAETEIDDLSIHQIVINTSVSITTDTVGSVTGKGQHGRNVRISNGVNAINVTCETSSDADFAASYTKLGSGAITFMQGSGATLVQVDGTAILNGIVGSTACLTRSGNTYYLQISNR